MTDVNYFSPPEMDQATTPPKNKGGVLIALLLLLGGFVWYFLSRKTAEGTNTTPADTGAGYSETISGGSDATSENPLLTYNIRDAATSWWDAVTGAWGGLLAPGNAVNPTNTNDAVLSKLSGAKVADATTGNAATILMAAMQANPSAVSTVKLPLAMQVAIAKSKASTSGPGRVYTDVDGTKVTIGSYDYTGASGTKYETSENGFGYANDGIVSVAGNAADAIAQNEAKLATSKPSSTSKTAGNAAQTLASAMSKNSSSVATVKLPVAMQAAIDKSTKTHSQGGTAYNALSAAMAKRIH